MASGKTSTLLSAITEIYYGGQRQVVQLLREYLAEPDKVRIRTQLKSNFEPFRHQLAGELWAVSCGLFTLVVCVSDGLLRVDEDNWWFADTVSFFNIADQLPMELQMLLCYRVFDSGQQIVIAKEVESNLQRLSSSGFMFSISLSLRGKTMLPAVVPVIDNEVNDVVP